MRHPERTVALLAACAAVAWAVAARCDEPLPLATVARFLGPEGKDLGGEAFADALSRAGLPATAVGGRAAGWRQPAVAGGPWLCGLTAGFGERAHAYAVWFGAAGIPERFVHVPYGKTTLPGGDRVWLAPVDRLAAAVADAAGRPPLSGPPLGIRVLREESAGDAGPVAEMQVYEAIAWAAACEAGWTPTAAATATAATLRVEVGVKSATFRLAVESAGRRRELVKREVSGDDVHEVLRRMFACAMPDAVASDFLRLGAGNEVIRWRGGEASLDPGTSGAAAIAPLQPATSWSFEREGDLLVAVAADTGRRAWSCPLGDVPLEPPTATPAGLLVVTKSSRLMLLDPDSGRIRVERQLTGWVGDVAVLPGRKGGAAARLACLVRDGTLMILDADSLDPVLDRSLPVRPGYGRAARLLVVPDFPVTWPGPTAIADAAGAVEEELDAELVATAECLLATDEQGYAWIVPTSRLMEGRR